MHGEEPAANVRVLLVDDHDLFRTGLRNLLEERGVQVAGEAGAGADAVRLVRELAPEVVVMDLHMPGMSGIEAIRQIISFAPLTRILVLTISDQDEKSQELAQISRRLTSNRAALKSLRSTLARLRNHATAVRGAAVG